MINHRLLQRSNNGAPSKVAPSAFAQNVELSKIMCTSTPEQIMGSSAKEQLFGKHKRALLARIKHISRVFKADVVVIIYVDGECVTFKAKNEDSVGYSGTARVEEIQ
jgi:hypothetical protein